MIDILADIVKNPQKYYHVVNLPLQFDAAKFLYDNHWDEIDDKAAAKVEEILVRSGYYE